MFASFSGAPNTTMIGGKRNYFFLCFGGDLMRAQRSGWLTVDNSGEKARNFSFSFPFLFSFVLFFFFFFRGFVVEFHLLCHVDYVAKVYLL